MSQETVFEHKYKNWGKQVYNTLQWLSLDLVKIIVEYGRELRLIQTFKLVLQVDKDSLIRVPSDGDMVICHKTNLYVLNPQGDVKCHWIMKNHITNMTIDQTSKKILVNVLNTLSPHDVLMEIDPIMKSLTAIINTPGLPSCLAWYQNKHVIIDGSTGFQNRQILIHLEESYSSLVYRIKFPKHSHGICMSPNGDVHCLNYNESDHQNCFSIHTFHVENQDRKNTWYQTITLKQEISPSISTRICYVGFQNEIVILQTKQLSVLQPIQFAHVISIYDKFGSLDALLDLNLVNTCVNDVCLDSNGRLYVLILNEIQVYDFY